ncbi:MAG: DUF3999 family protein [Rhodanobacter sp.]
MRRDSRWPRRCGWCLLAVWLPLVIHAGTADDFANGYTLTTHGSSAAWRIELDPAIYAVSRPTTDLGDIVVVNADGQPVPFGPLPPAPAHMQTFARATTLLPLPSSGSGRSDSVRVQRSPDGAIVIEQPSASAAPSRPDQWLLDAGRPASLDRITIDPSALPEDVRFGLYVQASNDLQHWSARGQTSEIVSVGRGAHALAQRSLTVANPTPARYYRLTLSEGGHAPWDSTQTPTVELHGSVAAAAGDHAARRQWLDAPAALTSGSTGGTDYDYTLPAALPLEAVRVVLAGSNTVARYRLLAHDSHGDRLLAAGTAVQIGTEADTSAPIAFAPQRVQHLRVHVDTPLAQAPTLRVAWRPDVFVFLAEGSGPYRLLAGSYAARRGDYPLSAALDRIRAAAGGADWQPPLATLGPASMIKGAAALLAPKAPFDWMGPLLWLVLIGGVLAVAAMAWSLLRQSRRDGGGR